MKKEGNDKHAIFKTTDKGKKFIFRYEALKEMIED